MQFNTVLRWTARVWGIASFLLILAFVAGGAERVQPTANEAVGLLLFPVGVVVGFGIAWWREGVGGLVTAGSLALFYLWIFGRDGRLPPGTYFLLLSAPGFLHIANALLCRSWKTRAEGEIPPAKTAG
jgi:hypothetical protein